MKTGSPFGRKVWDKEFLKKRFITTQYKYHKKHLNMNKTALITGATAGGKTTTFSKTTIE
jgi:type IV secretory pathway ATPase VirB11/archaellum biosynthesis ATPase